MRHKMTGRTLWTLLLFTITLSFPSVFCRHDYAQYYISKYHKVVSTTESISSSRSDLTTDGAASSSTGVSSELKNIITSTEDSSSEERVSVSESEDISGLQGNETVIQQGYGYNDNFTFVIRIVIIVVSVIIAIFVLGCIVCCCPVCRGKSHTGFIIRDNIQSYPQQPLVPQPPPPQTAVLVQHFPPNYPQEPVQQPYVPPYPHPGQEQAPYSPMQPPSQYSPNSLQFYNPPEAPPPYEDAPYHKY